MRNALIVQLSENEQALASCRAELAEAQEQLRRTAAPEQTVFTDAMVGEAQQQAEEARRDCERLRGALADAQRQADEFAGQLAAARREADAERTTAAECRRENETLQKRLAAQDEELEEVRVELEVSHEEADRAAEAAAIANRAAELAKIEAEGLRRKLAEVTR